MDKAHVAEILEEIGTLLELNDENPFKSRAYHNASRLIGGLDQDLKELVQSGGLKNLKGIGPALTEKITELVTTGKSSYLEELQKALPSGLLEMVRIQGVGPKRAKILYDKLKIKDIKGLEQAAKKGLIAGIEGFGEKSQDNILEGIAFLSAHAEYHHFNVALEAGEQMLQALKKAPGVEEISLCGSLRRRKELIRDVDILVASEKPAQVTAYVVKQPFVARVLGQGDTKTSVLLKDSGIQVDVRVLKKSEYPFAQHYFTGSKEHNIVMRQRAQDRGLKLSEYGLFKGTQRILCKNEAEIFEKLGLQYIPPEMREDHGEIEAAEKKKLPRLIEEADLRGAFHVHSTWSDGKASLEDMIAAAEEKGWEYVGISDHSKSAAYANGLTEERVAAQAKEIEKVRKKFKIHIFWGTECDILKDGSLDYPEKILENYDFVVGSVHSLFKMTEADMTRRIVQALKTGYVTILGHMTGRLLLQREPYLVNTAQVLDAAADHNTAVELNAHPYRFDIDWRNLPLAKEKGAKISIDPDAHTVNGLNVLPYGIGLARKGWLTASDVINTMPLAKMQAWLKSRRK